MEAAEGVLDKIRPPRLEDAGLEDCALPPESIKEAFLKAATAVRSRAASIFSDSDGEVDGNCLNDPWPTAGESSDTLVGIMPEETETPGACAADKGGGVPDVVGDEVSAAVPETGDKVVGPDLPEEGGEACVDGLQRLKIGEKLKNDNDEGEEDETAGERPILTETYV